MRIGLVEAWGPLQQQQIRCKSKAAKEEERNVVVKLLKDVTKWGRAGRIDVRHSRNMLKLRQAPMFRSTQAG
jgi:hypothetical protein